jgi:transposase, IS6 family
MMAERGLQVAHSTIYRWVIAYSPELDQRCRAHLRPSNDSWRVDETYIKVKGEFKYLYRAIDSNGNTIDFLLTENRNATTAKKFFLKAFQYSDSRKIRVVNVNQDDILSQIKFIHSLFGIAV